MKAIFNLFNMISTRCSKTLGLTIRLHETAIKHASKTKKVAPRSSRSIKYNRSRRER